MKKVYEVKFKDGNKLITVVTKGHTLVGSLINLTDYLNVYDKLVSVNEIDFERYHILNLASAIREADTWDECKNECAELCRLAGLESEWREADGETFEEVLGEASKRLGVDI